MQKHNYLQKDYTTNGIEKQLKIPFEIELKIEKSDPVILLSQYVEEMDLTDLYSTLRFLRLLDSHFFIIMQFIIMSLRELQKLITPSSACAGTSKVQYLQKTLLLRTQSVHVHRRWVNKAFL